MAPCNCRSNCKTKNIGPLEFERAKSLFLFNHLKMEYVEDYNAFFDRNAYRDLMESAEMADLPRFISDSLHKVYTSGLITGGSILDFGTGSSLNCIASAARYFDDIYLSDFLETNRNALWRWLTGQPESTNFSHVFKDVCRRERSSETWKEREEDTRRKVRGVLYCDMTRDNPLHPSIYPQFDVINSTLCLDIVPSCTIPAYRNAIKNVSSLLKPGGWLTLTEVLGCTYYKVGQYTFKNVEVDAKQVKECWLEAGFKIEAWEQYDVAPNELLKNPFSDHTGAFCMAARKNDAVQ